MPEQTRPSWDVGRFLQTLSYFEAVPILNWFQKMMPGFIPPAPPAVQTNLIFDFSQSTQDIRQLWGAVDDVVMGGVSNSGLQHDGGVAVFSGHVSTANSGGFASVRTRNFEPPLNLSAYQGIEVQVKGDGQRYKFLLRDQDSWDSIAYAYSFDTIARQWITVRIPFNQLVPVFRAKTVQDAPPIQSQTIRAMQIMLSKFEYDGALNPRFTPGEFHLAIKTIGVY
ncbi:MAG: CIA30 family protein [Acaryochloris sp. RU_4_1]|nr:CIA30 family protein [Acaryochloris sp. SU_5_25]NJM66161.1 CIA30 family protein [Acaryochloris sp. RU_4_1]